MATKNSAEEGVRKRGEDLRGPGRTRMVEEIETRRGGKGSRGAGPRNNEGELDLAIRLNHAAK